MLRCGEVRDHFEAKIVDLTEEIYKRLNEKDATMVDMQSDAGKVESQFHGIKEDIQRHETMCYEIASKFENQHDVII